MNYHHVDRSNKQSVEKHRVDAVANLLVAILIIAFMSLFLVFPAS